MSGIQDIPIRVPREYEQASFQKWFEGWVKDALRNADIRNADGVGISIEGDSDSVATLTSTSLGASYIVVSASDELTDERVLVTETDVLLLTDAGPGVTITISIVTNGVDFDKLQQIAQDTYLGRVTSGTGDIEATATNDAFNKNFGTSAGTVLEGDTTPSDIGAQVQDDTLDGIAATDPTTDEINYFTATNVASVTSLTAFARTLIDDTTQGAMQTTLDVDPSGTDNSTNVTLAGTLDYLTLSGQEITLNAIDLTTDVSGDLPVTDGGTGASTAATARTNLGVAIGSDVQAFAAPLDVLSGGTATSTSFTLEIADAATSGNLAVIGSLNAREMRVGNKVSLHMLIRNIDTTGMTAANNLFFRNLTFTSEGSSSTRGFVGPVLAHGLTFSGYVVARMLGGRTYFQLSDIASGAGDVTLKVSSIDAASSDLNISIEYFV